MEGTSRHHTGPAVPKFCLGDHPHQITFCRRSSHPKPGHGELGSAADHCISLAQLEQLFWQMCPCCSWLLLSRPGVLFFTEIQTLQLSQLL